MRLVCSKVDALARGQGDVVEEVGAEHANVARVLLVEP